MSTEYATAQGRKFGLTVGIAFGILGGIARWRGHPGTFVTLASIGVVLVVAAILVPKQLRVVDAAWMKLAHLISKVTTPIFMGVIYFGVLTPVGAARRTFGRKALVHETGPHGLWADRSANPPSSLDRLF